MDKFDEKVIGYESTKEILRQILDILKEVDFLKFLNRFQNSYTGILLQFHLI